MAAPRAVIVTRETAYDVVVAANATPQNAAFYLRNRKQSLDTLTDRSQLQQQAVNTVAAAVPGDWRVAYVPRDDLDQFLFEPDDVICVVGQDGLVANVSKYLDGQPVLGFNPDPEEYEGVLVPCEPWMADELVPATDYSVEERTMVRAVLDDGAELTCLNEIYAGHQSHQSARYSIVWERRQERQSSSGVIVYTGTGATGWARSIAHDRHRGPALSTPTDPMLGFFVREAFPAPPYQADLMYGLIEANNPITLLSEGEHVIFGDGIESDFLSWRYGQRVEVGIADKRLRLVVP